MNRLSVCVSPWGLLTCEVTDGEGDVGADAGLLKYRLRFR